MANRPVVHDLMTMGQRLYEDVSDCIGLLKLQDTQLGRRRLFRAVFAEIEGIAHGYKQMALELMELGNAKFTTAEVSLLREEEYSLDEKGIAQVTKARLSFASNVLFSLKAISRALGTNFVPPTSDARWQKLRTSLKVRDRLTHPKNAESLYVSDQEVLDLMAGHEWYWECRNAVFGFLHLDKSV